MSHTEVRVDAEVVAAFRALQSSFPALKPLGDLFQATVIIDASVVIQDLVWLCGKRQNPAARTALQEVIAGGTVRPTAPRHLDDEIRAKLPDVSHRESIAIALLRLSGSVTERRFLSRMWISRE